MLDFVHASPQTQQEASRFLVEASHFVVFSSYVNNNGDPTQREREKKTLSISHVSSQVISQVISQKTKKEENNSACLCCHHVSTRLLLAFVIYHIFPIVDHPKSIPTANLSHFKQTFLPSIV